MSVIRSQVHEWKRLDTIIKDKEKELRILRKQRKSFMVSIQEYLEATNQPGVKCGDVAIYKEQKTKHRVGRKQEDKEDDGVSVLRNHGISNARDVMKEIIDAMKGEEITESKIVLESIEKYKKKQKKKNEEAKS